MQVIALRERIDRSHAVFLDVEGAGIDVSKPIADLNHAWEKVLAARRQVHSLDDTSVSATLDEGRRIADRAYQDGILALQDLRQERRGLYILLAFVGTATLVGTWLVTRSIAMRRRETEALRLERQRIASSRERLARVGEISAGVAHTIRNPLHGVLNCVDILKAKLPAADHNQKVLSLMSEGLERIQSVTHRLLGLARETELRKTPTDINVLIEDTVRFMEVRCHKKGVPLNVKLMSPAPLVNIDPNQFSEALLNVLDNALAACDPGQLIQVSTSGHGGSEEGILIEVVDEGSGIPPEQREMIFDPFFSSKPIGEGTGLGLVITKRIVEEHGGEIRVESRLGEGTRVSLLIPQLH
jgi:signal transduction histidine kinase